MIRDLLIVWLVLAAPWALVVGAAIRFGTGDDAGPPEPRRRAAHTRHIHRPRSF